MTDLAADLIPPTTTRQTAPDVNAGATWRCALLVAEDLPSVPDGRLSYIVSEAFADVDPVDVTVSLVIIDGASRLTAAPASFDVEDITITGALWSFLEPDDTVEFLSDATGMPGRVMRVVMFDVPFEVVGAGTLVVDWLDPLVVRQVDPAELA